MILCARVEFKILEVVGETIVAMHKTLPNRTNDSL